VSMGALAHNVDTHMHAVSPHARARGREPAVRVKPGGNRTRQSTWADTRARTRSPASWRACARVREETERMRRSSQDAGERVHDRWKPRTPRHPTRRSNEPGGTGAW